MEIAQLIQIFKQKKCLSSLLRNIDSLADYDSKDKPSANVQTFGNIGKTPVSVKVFLKLTKNIPDEKQKRKWFDLVSEKYGKSVHDTYGLLYEINFYERIANYINKNKFSPNFVIGIGSTFCTRDQINMALPESFEKFAADYPTVPIGFLVTSRVPGNVMPLSKLKFVPDEVMFQIVFSLGVLQRFKSVHNDLHAGNILLRTISKPMEVFYRYGKKLFRIETDQIPYLFDWDLAYSELLGPNKKLDIFEYVELYNRFNSKKDLYTLVCTLGRSAGQLYDIYRDNGMKAQEDQQKLRVTPEFKNLRLDPNQNFHKMQAQTLREYIYYHGDQKLLPENGLVTFEKYGSDMIRLYKGFRCRLNAYSDKFPSPFDLLDGDYFEKFQIPSDSKVIEELHFTMPPKYFASSIYIDENIPSTRNLIQGKPRFPEPKKGTRILSKIY